MMPHKLVVKFMSGGSHEQVTCDEIKEKEHGIELLEHDGTGQIGYIPYDGLKCVKKNDSED